MTTSAPMHPDRPGREQMILLQLQKRRDELEHRLGLGTSASHFHRPLERPFTKDQRPFTTVLHGGLSPRHDRLVEGVLKGLGYRAQALPPVGIEAYERGREYGNNGFCNPTYFTVGNLVAYLQQLEAQGLSRRQIVDEYVFFTASSCGTCRFGMYEAEYRFALANAGFDGFRVLVFGTDDGLDQSSGGGPGLDLNLDFFLGVITAFNTADVLHQLVHKIRPYEAESGAVDRAADEALASLHTFFAGRGPPQLADSRAGFLADTRFERPATYVHKIASQVWDDGLIAQLERVRERFDSIEIDPFRVKPIVKVLGEFWAQGTQGAGNFHIHRFLEREGAEAYVDRALFTRLAYLLHMHKQAARDRRGLHGVTWRELSRRLDEVLTHYRRYCKKCFTLTLAEKLLKHENDRALHALGGTLHAMVSQYELERVARPFWNWRTCSGESHLEVAENIYYHQHHLCHMALSLKPFTCMPSTQSDGVQAKVVEQVPGMIFLPIETSGDGEIIAHSRVQMALGGARAKARKEWATTLARTGRSVPELQAFVDDHPELKRATYPLPHTPGVVGRAANMAIHVAKKLSSRPLRISFSRRPRQAVA